MKKLSILSILIIVLVLVIMIIVFSLRQSKISPGDMKNIDSVKTSCSMACSSNNSFDYCSVLRLINDGDNPPFEATCYELSKNEDYARYEISVCPQIKCFG
jgi:hypothetical protein